jgi:hypothetical protein
MAAGPAQVTFEQATRDLASPDAATRLRAAQMLREAAYPEAAVPMAALVTDPEGGIRLEAIAAELNIFLAEKIVPRKRLALVIEVRNPIASDVAFSRGPFVLGSHSVPREVLESRWKRCTHSARSLSSHRAARASSCSRRAAPTSRRWQARPSRRCALPQCA